MGADRVIVLDRLENRLRLAEEFGADYTINIEEYNTPESRIQRIKELTRGGTFVEIGLYFSGQRVPFDPSTLVLTGKRIMGSVMYRPVLMSTILDFLVRTRHKLPFHTLGGLSRTCGRTRRHAGLSRRRRRPLGDSISYGIMSASPGRQRSKASTGPITSWLWTSICGRSLSPPRPPFRNCRPAAAVFEGAGDAAGA
jgi:threonine dehydrogenase-like Zn-dependent dehydrogenase